MKYNNVHIASLAYALPTEVVTTWELEERLEDVYGALHISKGQLEAMTGIVERRYWEPGTSVSDAATQAATRLLEGSDVPHEAIGALLYCGVCRDGFEPATACHVAGKLRARGIAIAPDAFVYDVGNACLGVLNGVVEVANRIELGQIRAGLVVTAETAREIVDAMIEQMKREPTMETFKTAIATMTGGSAAVAVLVTDAALAGGRRKVLGGVAAAAPEHHDLCVWGIEPHPDHPEPPGNAAYRQTMSTHSVEVLDHGVVLGRRAWGAFLAELGWGEPDVTKVVSHQVGSSHRAAYLKALGIDDGKDFIAYDYLGNTGTAALPLATALAEQRGFIDAGDRVALLGIGSGLNCMMLGVDW